MCWAGRPGALTSPIRALDRGWGGRLSVPLRLPVPTPVCVAAATGRRRAGAGHRQVKEGFVGSLARLMIFVEAIGHPSQ